MTPQELLDEIERGALDESVSLVSVFRTCRVLARKTGSAMLRDYARSELKGYHKSRVRDDSWIPRYRMNIPLTRDFLTDTERQGAVWDSAQWIMGIEGLESRAASDNDMIYHSYEHGLSLRRSGASKVSDYRERIAQIRAALVGFVAEVREEPTAEAIDRAVRFIRTGNRDA